jgi:hypothetical protein
MKGESKEEREREGTEVGKERRRGRKGRGREVGKGEEER